MMDYWNDLVWLILKKVKKNGLVSGFQGVEIRNWVTKLLHTLTEAFKQG